MNFLLFYMYVALIIMIFYIIIKKINDNHIFDDDNSIINTYRHYTLYRHTIHYNLSKIKKYLILLKFYI